MSDSLCPLVTDYTNELGISPEVLERLYLVRKWDIDPDHPEINPIPFKWPSSLRTKVFNLKTEQEDEELVLRQYQIQVIHHLVRMNRFMCGDAVGLRKTSDAIAAVCWLRDRIPDLKALVVTTLVNHLAMARRDSPVQSFAPLRHGGQVPWFQVLCRTAPAA